MMKFNLVSILSLALIGCVGNVDSHGKKHKDVDPTTTVPVNNDVDGDGHDSVLAGGDDCNDSDASINPEQVDNTCDGVDQNCDGIDADALDTAHARTASACGGVDNDEDGYMDQDGDGAVIDCDDTDPDVNPGASETWYNGTDENCDGNDADQDLDGSLFPADCDDLDSSINPLAAEILDNGVDENCDPADNLSAGAQDDDGDGFAATDDCDDTDGSVHPGATEVPYDGLDQDCDGADLDDVDCDGFARAVDCDDANVDIYPGATEVCGNIVDENCDGQAPGLDAVYPDADGDGYGDMNATGELVCEDAIPAGYVYGDSRDCDDTDATVGEALTFREDLDGDGHGNPETAQAGCEPGPGYADVPADDCDDTDPAVFNTCVVDDDGDGFAVEDDCDDADADINPAALEIANDGIDQDCDGIDLACVLEGTFTMAVGWELTTVHNIAGQIRQSDGTLQVEWADGNWQTASIPGMTVTTDDVSITFTYAPATCSELDLNIETSVDYTADTNGDGVGDSRLFDCQRFGLTGDWDLFYNGDVETIAAVVWDPATGACTATGNVVH